MQLYFIRHGQSENNLLWAETGSSQGRSEDPGLTPVGRRQAELVARFLSRDLSGPESDSSDADGQNVNGFGITHLYTSLMIRAVATGTIVATALDLPLVAWKDVHEFGGIYRNDEGTNERIGLPGNDRAYFGAHYPGLVLPDSLGEGGWWNRPYEQPEERPPRARRFLNELLDRHGATDDRVAVVSHGGFFNHLLRAVLNLPEDSGCWFSMNNAAVTRIDFGEGEVAVRYLNRVDFLPSEFIT
ncbi:MAG: histidine phosphatase family protein [Anaerolineae bacterium]|nr:MAG: histidine phosphatase family protein [Anaerolineae bacterium]